MDITFLPNNVYYHFLEIIQSSKYLSSFKA